MILLENHFSNAQIFHIGGMNRILFNDGYRDMVSGQRGFQDFYI